MRKHTFIIAEAGVNHNGDIAVAKKMIDAAVYAGADCIKFQTYITEDDTAIYAPKAEYQKRNTLSDAQTQYEMLKRLELSYEEFGELEKYCTEKGIQFLSSPFEIRSIHFLNKLGIPFWKIPSSEITNYPYLREIAMTEKPIVMSTGMCRGEDVEDALMVLRRYGERKIILLQCNTDYPTDYKDVNLKGMLYLQKRFGLPIGISDHTVGIEVAIAAAALGATIIEKHFTLDKRMPGPDQAASIDVDELKHMVESIRNIEEALGEEDKIITNSEKKNLIAARKSIVAKQRIEKGEIFSEENIVAKRPGGGINPMEWEKIIGLNAKHSFDKDEMIEL